MRPMKHFTPQDPTPRDLGFAMPPEWALHEATWMGYPADDELWFGHLAGVRDEYVGLVKTIARFERVELLVRDEESERDARARLAGHDVRFHRAALDDSPSGAAPPASVLRACQAGSVPSTQV